MMSLRSLEGEVISQTQSGRTVSGVSLGSSGKRSRRQPAMSGR